MLLAVLFGSIAFWFYIVARRLISLPIWLILFIAIVLRIFIILVFPHSTSSDMQLFLQYGDIARTGLAVYPSNYFPFIYYLSRISLDYSRYIDPKIFLKLVFSFFDVGTVYLVYILSGSTISAFLYSLSPIILFVINIHGQMDSIVLFFLLIAIYFSRQRNDMASALALSVGIFAKPMPVLFLLPFLKHARRLGWYLLIPLLPAATVVLHSLAYHISVVDIITPIKDYRGVQGVWGVSALLTLLIPWIHENWIRFVRRVFLISYALFLVLYKKKSLSSDMVLIMLFFFVFTISFGAQWLTWLVPITLIARPRGWLLWNMVTVAYIFITFYADASPIPESVILLRDRVSVGIGFIVWFQTIRMFWWHLRSQFTTS